MTNRALDPILILALTVGGIAARPAETARTEAVSETEMSWTPTARED